jgi:hypothetical protein
MAAAQRTEANNAERRVKIDGTGNRGNWSTCDRQYNIILKILFMTNLGTALSHTVSFK